MATMLFGSKAQDLVRESWSRAVLSGEAERKARAYRRICMLNDDYGGQVLEAMREVVKDETVREAIAGHIRAEHNVMRRIVDTISMVYAWGATRSVGAGDAAVYKSILEECRINARLSTANRLCNAVNEVLVRPVVRNGRMQLDIATPDMVTAIPSDDDETVPALLIVHRLGRRNGAPIGIMDAWTDTQIQRYESPVDITQWPTKKISIGTWFDRLAVRPLGPPVDHGYRDEQGAPLMPWVIAHRKEPIDSIWNETDGQGMVSVTITVNLILGLLRRLSKDQGELQLAWSGSPSSIPPKNQVVDALSILIGGDGDFKVLPLQANPDLYLRQVDARLTAIALEFGIPPDAFSGKQVNTSFAVMMQRAPLLEIRGRQIAETWEHFERQLVRAMAAVARKDHPTLKFSSEGFKVQFSDAPMVGSPKELEELFDLRIAAGRLDPIEALRMTNTDLTYEEAKEKQKRIAKGKKIWMDLMRETNAPRDPNDPGRSPEENGAMGPKVRDGKDDEGEEDQPPSD